MSWYDIKQSDGEAPVLKYTSLLPSFTGPLWPGEIALDIVLSIGQIELSDFQTYFNNCLMPNWIVRNRTVSSYQYLEPFNFVQTNE